ncbi:MAG TPA: TlpA disulfide reductase family protein [Acidimicrobiales bacterium]|nr:TlpA disulfide reductase family protein [Acidimicrobiales bacterium]
MPLDPGTVAPDFRLPGGDGHPHGLGDLTAGGAALLIFFKCSCPTCQLAFPVYGELARRYGDVVPVVAVSQDPLLKAREWLHEKGFAGLVVDDTPDHYAASRAFGIDVLPTMVLVDGERTVVQVSQGWDRDGTNEMAAALGRIAGRPGDPVSTEADGRPVFKPG